MSSASTSFTAGLWDDIVRRVAGHNGVLKLKGAAAAGVDAAAILRRGVLGDAAVVDGERARVGDAAPAAAGTIAGEHDVLDSQRARVADAASGPLMRRVLEERGVLDT